MLFYARDDTGASSRQRQSRGRPSDILDDERGYQPPPEFDPVLMASIFSRLQPPANLPILPTRPQPGVKRVIKKVANKPVPPTDAQSLDPKETGKITPPPGMKESTFSTAVPSQTAAGPPEVAPPVKRRRQSRPTPPPNPTSRRETRSVSKQTKGA